jgi:DNA-binding response OmpR family regulator
MHLSTVVVVDDDEDNVGVLEVGLQTAGFEVKTARSVREALELLAAGHVDALVTDYTLGDGTALDLLASLGANRPRLAIVVTGRSSPEDVELSRAAGFDAHLVKPINFGELELMLRAPSIAESTSSVP